VKVAPAIKTASTVWLLLIGITCLSTWGLAGGSAGVRVASTAILLLAAFKVRLVLMYFMELRTAPLPWRALFEGWILALTAALLICYWRTP
jgi:heme/copper-type cytochrome/quinol oxidase subunit 4